MADAPDLGSGVLRAGSSPVTRTKKSKSELISARRWVRIITFLWSIEISYMKLTIIKKGGDRLFCGCHLFYCPNDFFGQLNVRL